MVPCPETAELPGQSLLAMAMAIAMATSYMCLVIFWVPPRQIWPKRCWRASQQFGLLYGNQTINGFGQKQTNKQKTLCH